MRRHQLFLSDAGEGQGAQPPNKNSPVLASTLLLFRFARYRLALVPNSIRIESEVLLQVQAHARRAPERECCGLLAGREGVVTRAHPARNAAANPAKEYQIAAEELFQLMRGIREAGMQLLGIYHSHPNGLQEPSPRDVELAYYPSAVYLIISMCGEAGENVRAFSIQGLQVSELKIEIAGNS